MLRSIFWVATTLTIHRECAGAATSDTAEAVVGDRFRTETVIFEIEYDGVFARRNRLGTLPADAMDVKQVIGEDRLALQQVQPISAKSAPLADQHALRSALRHHDLNRYCV